MVRPLHLIAFKQCGDEVGSSQTAFVISPTLSFVQLRSIYSSMDTAFRKIDIDQYDEDRLVPQDLYDPDPRGPDGVLADARNRSAEVRSLLSR
jgi:hypothetical protein